MNEAQLRAEITQLERDRDSADTERECFAVRKAKESDERVEAALKEQRDMNADYATQCGKHEKTIANLQEQLKHWKNLSTKGKAPLPETTAEWAKRTQDGEQG